MVTILAPNMQPKKKKKKKEKNRWHPDKHLNLGTVS